jgi:hypothetical protein
MIQASVSIIQTVEIDRLERRLVFPLSEFVKIYSVLPVRCVKFLISLEFVADSSQISLNNKKRMENGSAATYRNVI